MLSHLVGEHDISLTLLCSAHHAVVTDKASMCLPDLALLPCGCSVQATKTVRLTSHQNEREEGDYPEGLGVVDTLRINVQDVSSHERATRV
jgi:hypothetical protein